VVAWLVPSRQSAAAAEAWTAFAEGRDEFVAPPLLYPETISSIRRLTSRGLLTPDEGTALVADFLALEIPTPTPPGLHRHAYELATRFHHSKAYDAFYLALADILSCRLLTLDRRLYDSVVPDFTGIMLVAQ
jgi:predicted nucleic acid-binding protein